MKFLPGIEIGSLYINMVEMPQSKEILLKRERSYNTIAFWPNPIDSIKMVHKPTYHRWSENGQDYISTSIPVKIMRTK